MAMSVVTFVSYRDLFFVLRYGVKLNNAVLAEEKHMNM